MTIPATTRRAGPYPGNGSSKSFPFAFAVLGTAPALQVLLNDGTTETAAATSAYTVTVNADQVASPGGTITFTTAPASGITVTVLDNTPADQQTLLPTGGAYRAKVVETAFDKLTVLVQKLIEGFNRTLRLPASVAGVSAQLPVPKGGTLVGWNSAGTGLVNFDPTVVVTTVAYGTARADLFTGDGTKKVFNLSADPGALANLDVSQAGTTLLPGIDYTLTTGSSPVITMTAAPGVGVKLLVRYMQALNVSGGDAGGVTYTAAVANAQSRTVADKLGETLSAFDFMTPAQIADVKARTRAQDVTLQLQRFFDAVAATGARGFMPAGDYAKSSQITLDPNKSYFIEGVGWGSNYTNQGSQIVDVGNGNGLFIYNPLANYAGGPAGGGFPNSDSPVTIRNLGFKGPGTNIAPGTQNIGIEGVTTPVQTGTGIFAYWANALRLENVWISGYPGDGFYGYRCFSSALTNCYIIRNNRCGVHWYGDANALILKGNRILANCLSVTSLGSVNANMLIDGGASYPSYGTTVDSSNDFSYAGTSSPWATFLAQGYSTVGGQSVSIVVTTGSPTVLTITFKPTSGVNPYAVGNILAVFGATSNKYLNHGLPAVVTAVTSGATSTITAELRGPLTAPAAGTYNVTTDPYLGFGPYAAGVSLGKAVGMKFNPYIEVCSGPAVRVQADCEGDTFEAGFLFNSKLVVETSWQFNGTSTRVAAGSGYVTGDRVQIVGGVYNTPAVFSVTAAAGAVTGLTLVSAGDYQVLPIGATVPTVALTGSGAGLTVNVGATEALWAKGIEVNNVPSQGAGAGLYVQNLRSVTVVGGQRRIDAVYGTPVDQGPNGAPQTVGGANFQGVYVGRGVDLNFSTDGTFAGDITNFAGGVNTLALVTTAAGGGAGTHLTAVGANALASNGGGYNNSALGWNAGNGIVAGFNNTALGARALDDPAASSIQSFTAVGFAAGSLVNSGSADTYLGFAAGAKAASSASGSGNTLIGSQAGRQNGTNVLSNCTILGANGVNLAADFTNFMALGYGAQSDPDAASNVTIIGNSSTTKTKIYGPVLQLGTTTYSGLPTAAAALTGSRAFVTDSATALAAGFGSVIAGGGGSNKVPVFCDGANWRLG